MHRSVLLGFTVIAVSSCGSTQRSVLAAPPLSIDELSHAEAFARCPGQSVESDPNKTVAFGIPFLVANFEAPSCSNTAAVSFGSGTGTASTSVTLEEVLDPNGEVVGIGPSVFVEATLVQEAIFGNPGYMTQANAELIYGYFIETSDEAPPLPGDLTVPIAIVANLFASAAPVSPNGIAGNTSAHATLGISAGVPPFFPLQAARGESFGGTTFPPEEDKNFFGIHDFHINTFYQIEMTASCQIFTDAPSDGQQNMCIAFVDPVFSIDVDSLRAMFVDLGIDHPAPEDLFQLRFSPDVQYSIDTFIPEPSGATLAILSLLGFSGGVRRMPVCALQ